MLRPCAMYDLRGQAVAWNKAQLPYRLFVIVCVITIFGFSIPLIQGFLAVVAGQMPLSRSGEVALVGVSVTWPLAAYGLWVGIWSMGSVASALRVDETALEFTYPSGRRRVVDLAGRKVRLTLEDLSGAPLG